MIDIGKYMYYMRSKEQKCHFKNIYIITEQVLTTVRYLIT